MKTGPWHLVGAIGLEDISLGLAGDVKGALVFLMAPEHTPLTPNNDTTDGADAQSAAQRSVGRRGRLVGIDPQETIRSSGQKQPFAAAGSDPLDRCRARRCTRGQEGTDDVPTPPCKRS
jgi:hypothetical protein